MPNDKMLSAVVSKYHGSTVSGRILIIDSMPEFKMEAYLAREKEAAAFFDAQAKEIVEVLVATLPGGTLDRVLAQLLHRSVSLHRIPWVKENETNV